MADAPSDLLPWLVAPLRRALETQSAHALLLHGPRGVGQFELAMALAQGWLCESDTVPMGARPCGVCASCRLVSARSHPDLLVLVPGALRESLGLATGEGDEGSEETSGKKKPSKEIRVDEVRVAIAFSLTTSARGRGKVVVVHPAERMNAIAANAFLKTLEEPPGNARFLLCSAAPDALLPTIRSRCQALALKLPGHADAVAWLMGQGVVEPEILLAACGGQPQEAAARAAHGIDAVAWRALPRRIAAGDASGLRGWSLPWVVDALQKLCHDVASVVAGALPRYFPAANLPGSGDLASLLRYARELRRFALHAEHPWIADLSVESLVAQGREALQTPRSQPG
ncbi:MAG: DNA polymerase III subunit delta' [Pseudomonadota bacterium]|nr:DNA polymerase III subunit delta' [Pseudomonadota bacterium]